MVIEWLKFEVAPADQGMFLDADAQVWTHHLQQYPGFLGKEVWCDPNHPAQLTLVIRWESYDAWKQIPIDKLSTIEQAFATAMVNHPYRLTEVGEYQVLRR